MAHMGDKFLMTIYGLIDPRTYEIKYVGQTNSLLKRMVNHLRMADKLVGPDATHTYQNYGPTPKDKWLAELHSLRLEAFPVILEKVIREDTNKRERYWINKYKSTCLNKKIPKILANI